MLAKVFSIVAGIFLKASGWKIEGELPSLPKYIVITAPHTSNWDFFLFLALGLHWRMMGKTHWFAKHTIFVGWIGRLLRSMGGIPVDRAHPHRLVEHTIAAMAQKQDMILVLAPEGTRHWTDHWKRGFYLIATKTELPLALAFINYADKVIGIGPTIRISGDADKDWPLIRSFYQQHWARHPADFSTMRFKDSARSARSKDVDH